MARSFPIHRRVQHLAEALGCRFRARKPKARERGGRPVGLAVETLEGRLVPTVFTVSSLSDAAVNLDDSVVTLRDAIYAANSDLPVAPLSGSVASTSVTGLARVAHLHPSQCVDPTSCDDHRRQRTVAKSERRTGAFGRLLLARCVLAAKRGPRLHVGRRPRRSTHTPSCRSSCHCDVQNHLPRLDSTATARRSPPPSWAATPSLFACAGPGCGKAA